MPSLHATEDDYEYADDAAVCVAAEPALGPLLCLVCHGLAVRPVHRLRSAELSNFVSRSHRLNNSLTVRVVHMPLERDCGVVLCAVCHAGWRHHRHPGCRTVAETAMAQFWYKWQPAATVALNTHRTLHAPFAVGRVPCISRRSRTHSCYAWWVTYKRAACIAAHTEPSTIWRPTTAMWPDARRVPWQPCGAATTPKHWLGCRVRTISGVGAWREGVRTGTTAW